MRGAKDLWEQFAGWWLSVAGAEANLDDGDIWQWWLEHGFDGIAGGVIGGGIGGVVAWIAVRRTIEHERGINEKASKKADRQELRQAVLAVQDAIAQASETPVNTPEYRRQYVRWYNALGLVEALAHDLEDPIEHEARDLRTYAGQPEIRSSRKGPEAMSLSNNRMFAWLRGPEEFAKLTPGAWTGYQPPANEGETGAQTWSGDEAVGDEEPPLTE